MKEFIKGLTPEQQKELINLLRRNPSLNESTAAVLEDHLSGKSDDYNELFSKTEKPNNHEVSPAVAAFIAKSNKDRLQGDINLSGDTITKIK